MTNKANGVYYTPSPVVEYIVRTTLAPLVDDKSPMQLAGCDDSWQRDHESHPLTVLDPACGTGHFLLGVYQYLSNWCLWWYCEHDAEAWLDEPRAKICRVGDLFQLTPRERQRILRDHIFGVDTDEPAIEIAKQSLQLSRTAADYSPRKPVSPRRPVSPRPAARLGETRLRETLRTPPSSACLENIRIGNSLINSDFEPDFPATSRTEIRAFDWEREFPTVMASGGFDAIVGNPPYVNARLIKQEQGERVKRYYRDKYRCARRAFDLYVLFVERSQELLRPGGRAGLIVPNKIATLDYAYPCRELLLNETALDTITDVSEQQLFHDANVYPYIITWEKKRAAAAHTIRILQPDQSNDLSQVTCSHIVRQSTWTAENGFAIHDTLNIETRVPTLPLSRCGSIHSGTTGFSAEDVANALVEYDAATGADVFDFIVSGNIDRYSISPGNVRFMKRKFVLPALPMNAKAVSDIKRQLYANPKIVVAGMTRRLEASFDPGGLALGVQVYAVADLSGDWRYLLGVLNSKLISYLLFTRFPAKQLAGGYLSINKGQLAKLPIRSIDATDGAAVLLQHEIIELVEQMHQPDQSTDKIDREIDRLVYELYELTHAEIDKLEQNFSSITRPTSVENVRPLEC